MGTRHFIEVTIVSDGNHTYIFRFIPSQAIQILKILGMMAADKSLDFTWQDAALVGDIVRDTMKLKDLP